MTLSPIDSTEPITRAAKKRRCENSARELCQVPFEALLIAFEYLSLDDVTSVEATCVRWRDGLRSIPGADCLWRRHLWLVYAGREGFRDLVEAFATTTPMCGGSDSFVNWRSLVKKSRATAGASPRIGPIPSFRENERYEPPSIDSYLVRVDFFTVPENAVGGNRSKGRAEADTLSLIVPTANVQMDGKQMRLDFHPDNKRKSSSFLRKIFGRGVGFESDFPSEVGLRVTLTRRSASSSRPTTECALLYEGTGSTRHSNFLRFYKLSSFLPYQEERSHLPFTHPIILKDGSGRIALVVRFGLLSLIQIAPVVFRYQELFMEGLRQALTFIDKGLVYEAVLGNNMSIAPAISVCGLESYCFIARLLFVSGASAEEHIAFVTKDALFPEGTGGLLQMRLGVQEGLIGRLLMVRGASVHAVNLLMGTRAEMFACQALNHRRVAGPPMMHEIELDYAGPFPQTVLLNPVLCFGGHRHTNELSVYVGFEQRTNQRHQRNPLREEEILTFLGQLVSHAAD